MIDSVQRAAIDKYEIVVHRYNMWCREVVERSNEKINLSVVKKNKVMS